MTNIYNETSEDNVVQYKFTAYLDVAIWRYKWHYTERMYRIADLQDTYDLEQDIAAESADSDILDALPLLDILESESLYLALKELKRRELDLLFDLIVYEMKPSEIARKLGMTYHGAMSIYYRALQKLRKRLKGDDWT